MYTIDTETVGLHGIIALMQYARDDEDIKLWCPWTNPVRDTIDIIDEIYHHPGGILGFNLVFDCFHLYKLWTTFQLLKDIDQNLVPMELLESKVGIELLIDKEEAARDYPLCLKPATALDLFLHARKGPYQSTMDRKDIVIKKIPTPLAHLLAEELERRIPLKDIYFARRKDKNQPKWQVQDRKDSFGEIDPDWKNVVLRFKPSSALKNLAVDALNVPQEKVLRYADISPKFWPVEFGYAPFAKAATKIRYRDRAKEIRRRREFRNTWPDYIRHHIDHWSYNELARQYASDDIYYTRELYKFFNCPAFGDDDSILACMVGASRWRGYRVDIEGIHELRKKATERKFKTIINRQGQQEQVLVPTAPNEVKRYIMDACDATEKLVIHQGSTKKVTLQAIADDWKIPCPECTPIIINKGLSSANGPSSIREAGFCNHCKDKGFIKHEAALRSLEILESRKAGKEDELYQKLLAAGRLHASLKIIGTLSTRMAGADGLNIQAIKNTFDVKSRFLLAQLGYLLEGGDFEAFEVTIAVAEYGDEDLEKDLLTCEDCKGRMIFNQDKCEYACVECGGTNQTKIHGLFGTFLFPGMTYEEIKATDGKEDNKYTTAKQGVFLKIYGGEAHTMNERLGISMAIADEANRLFDRRYKGVFRSQERVANMFLSMKQPKGRGTKVEWVEPAEKIETMFGFSRYYTLENMICKAMYDLASRLPKKFKEVRLRVIRTDRQQLAAGATSSAIYSAAFALQGHNKRSALNHRIQGTGAQITKKVQRAIWDIQPCGIHEWLVQPLNIHDQVMTPVHPSVQTKVGEAVHKAVEEIRPVVPLIKMPWSTHLSHWIDKGGPVVSYNLETGKIFKAYKNRNKLKQFGLDKTEVIKVMSKQSESYLNLGWRSASKEEVKYLKGNNLLN